MAITETDTAIEAVTLSYLLAEHQRGAVVLVGYDTATRCLHALGKPLAIHTVRDLGVEMRTLSGRSVAPLADFVTAADAFIKRQLSRPHLKGEAAAVARAARRPRPAKRAAKAGAG